MSESINQFEAPADPDDTARASADLARAETRLSADVEDASRDLASLQGLQTNADFIEFELMEHDYVAAYTMASPLRQRFLVCIFLLLCIYEGIAFYHSNDLSDLTMAAVFLVYIIILRVSLRRSISRFYKQLNERDRKVTYSIEGEDLKVETERSMILLDADDIQKTKESPHYLLLYKTSAFFYVIPKDRIPGTWVARIKDVLRLSD